MKKFKCADKSKSKGQKGILTLDFIFSMTAVYSIAMVFVLLALTLMMSTVVQYISFSMARAHMSGDISFDEQNLATTIQRDKLLATDLGAFIKTTDEGWFKVEYTEGEYAFTNVDSEWSGSGGTSRQRAYGVKIKYTSNILKNFRLPMIGSPSDGANDDFASANIFSFLYREPTTEECLNFNNSRWQVLRTRFQDIGSMPNLLFDNSGAQADNGC